VLRCGSRPFNAGGAVPYDAIQQRQVCEDVMFMESKRKKGRGIRRQRGMSLVETAAVLGVAATAMGMFANTMADNSEQLKAKAAAERMIEVQSAAQAYIKAHESQLQTLVGTTPMVILAGKPSATGPVPAGPSSTTLPSLQGGGFLPPSFIDRNAYNQRHALLLRKTGPNPSDPIEAIVTTYGGVAVPDRQLGRIAGFVGAAGGYVPARTVTPADNGQIIGTQGGWRTSSAVWGAGTERPTAGSVVATMAYVDSNATSDFLYRTPNGGPEGNRMHASIDMNGNNVSGAGTVTSGTVVAGTAPPTMPAGTTLYSSGQARAATVVAGNPAGAVPAGINIWAAQGIRAEGNVSAAGAVTAGGAVSGATVSATAGNVSASGNMHATAYYGQADWGYYMQPQGTNRLNYVDANNVHAYGEVQADGWMRAGGNVVANAFLGQQNHGYYVDPDGTSRMNYPVADNIYSYGWMQADVFYDRHNNGYYLQPRGTNRMNSVVADSMYNVGNIDTDSINLRGVRTLGGGCSPNGAMARQSSGAPLFCVSGVWTAPGGGFIGDYDDLGSRVGTFSGTNSSSGTQLIIAWEGNVPSVSNQCQLVGSVSGFGTIVHDQDNTGTMWRTCTITFAVPPGRSWTVTSQPYASGAGTIRVQRYR